ncbi:MAG: butyrate kinase [Peptostreptococcaceae bacterium]|jgi:butyrate kinase|nr:butyrate kinase [Peptostreptococcaceae bacterium]
MSKKILAINPGSTSTKIAVYENEKEIFEKTLRHSNEEIEKYETISAQMDFRREVIEAALVEANIKLEDLSAIVGRGGLLKPMAGGTYKVNEPMLKDLEVGVLGEHASNLGGRIAHEMAQKVSIESFIVDPVVVDELTDVARVSGNANLERKSIFHALNQKATARRAAKELDKKYEESNIIVAHMGGGVSVGAHLNGIVVDVNNALDGCGPFSPERSGGIPAGDLVKMCFSGEHTLDEIKKMLKGNGGIVSYLNTNDARDVEAMIEKGDKKAELVYKAMAYQIGKEIGACAAVLKGKVDAIVLTGGIAYSKMFTAWIVEMIDFIGEVKIYPGEDEMSALAMGALRVLNQEEEAKIYN